MDVDWGALLSTHPMLALMPAGLRSAARPRMFAAGRTLHRRGERPAAMLYVLRGEVRLVRSSVRGGEIVLQRSRGGFVAEASMGAEAYHCDIVAATEGSLLGVAMSAFRCALEEERDFRAAWMERLAGEVRKLRAQSERLSLNSAAERVLHYIEAEGVDGAVTLTQSRKAWAAELGLTHEAVYRTLRRLCEEGVLSMEGERLVLRKC